MQPLQRSTTQYKLLTMTLNQQQRQQQIEIKPISDYNGASQATEYNRVIPTQRLCRC